MADRDNYRTDPNPWDRNRGRGGPDAADRLDADRYGWTGGDEGRSFGRDPAQTGQSSRSDYGGQGAYGQGRGPGAYGYGSGVEGSSDRSRAGERYGQRDERSYDYDRGGQGGYAGGRPDRGQASWAWERGAYAQAGYDPGEPRGLNQDRSPSEFYGQSGQRRAQDHEHGHDPHYSSWRASQLEAHDRDYAHWREQQAKRYDDDYGQYRGQKHEAFSKEFESWRSSRDKARQQPTDLTVSPPEVENVSDGRKPSDDRNKN